MTGDVDIAAVAALLAERPRARILLALDDGRALPASVLAAEAGVAPSTASGHLARLVAGGLLAAEQHGRHRYYRLADAAVGELIETLARLAPRTPVTSLREGTRARTLRRARTCYDHLAGELGTALMAALLREGLLAGGDGSFEPARSVGDRPSAHGSDVDYRLTDHGVAAFRDFGVDVANLPGQRPLIRYCVDWSEQRHHLAGRLGAALLRRLFEREWLRRAGSYRAVELTPAGRRGLAETFGLELASDV